MSIRKLIAVISMDIANDYMNRMLDGIAQQASALGYDVITLLMSLNINSANPIQDGEENIYRLISVNNVDGIILLTGNAANPQLVNRICSEIKLLDLPVISIDTEYDFCETIFADEASVFEKMTDHFIERHNCRKLMCLTGYKGLTPSESRMEGYKRSLKKHGIPLREDFMVYGDFWKPSGVKLAHEILSGERELPDAIVCANDAMAIHLCNTLISGGINVPDDVMISGCDCSRDAIENIPSMTSVLPENSILGARAVLRIHKLMTGEEAEMVELPAGSLILAGTCGCNNGLNSVVRQRENNLVITETHERYFDNSGMAEGLMQASNLDHLLHLLSNYMYLLPELDVFMINLNENWDSFEQTDENEYLRVGYPDVMETKFVYSDTDVFFVDCEYPTNEIIPPLTQKYVSEPSMYFVLPLHFMDRCFGYTVFKFHDISITANMLFNKWNRNINTALEFLRVRTKLTAINQRISLSSVRDTLTGAFNRQGFKRFSDFAFKKAKAEGKPFFLLIADLDLLKHINDNYGHIEGDSAIIVAANGLNTCCENNEICARIGGDEYAIVGCYDYTDEKINSYITYIHEYFSRYNASSGKPYTVEASLGWFCGVPEADKDIEYYMKIADKRMYEDKFRRKKIRKD